MAIAAAATRPVTWVRPPDGVSHCGTRVGATDGEALRDCGNYIRRAEGSHLTVTVDLIMILGSETARRQHHAGESDQREAGCRADHRFKLGKRKTRQLELRQPCWDRPHHRDAVRIQSQQRHAESGDDQCH